MSDLSTQPKRAEASLGDLISEMTSELSTLFRQEVELAKTEAREEIVQTGKGAGMMGAAGLAAWLTVVFLSFALAWLLDQGLNRALSFVIVAVLWAIAGAVLFTVGRKKLQRVRALPETKQSLKEDAAWARAQKS